MDPKTTEQVLSRLAVIETEAKRKPVTSLNGSGGTIFPRWVNNPLFAITPTRLKSVEAKSDIKPPLVPTTSTQVSYSNLYQKA
ncbi:hypothetical protein AC579_3273 [Pseudocercospora musae]|uniref:Uncharacterized protein n=1 Tax=Pseudocercospora musae TaxID=113226 RepID=A0A139IDB7_9PEZI|nr:hypothetical protein AC579_3273 [Pseudocercospora musae]